MDDLGVPRFQETTISLGQESFGVLYPPCFAGKPRESHPHDSKAPTEKQPQQSAVHFLCVWMFFFPWQCGALRKKEVVEEEVGE